MRADRLVSLVLLLRQRGRMTAAELAAELEVSTRTVLRDVEALSSAGVPVYADRGRHGGFSLLPGFRTELTGLTHDEALALLAATTRRSDPLLGLSPALASAVRKVVDALPAGHRDELAGATRRILVEPGSDLLARPAATEAVPAAVMDEVRRAVLAGRRLRLRHAAPGAEARERVVDPLGLVTVRGRTYLLASRDGADRTYRLSRVVAAQMLPEPAARSDDVDLRRLWSERSARFLAGKSLVVDVRVRDERREELLDTVRAVRAAAQDGEGWSRLEVVVDDLRHAVWALWRLGTEAEALGPVELRVALAQRASEMFARYNGSAPARHSQSPRAQEPARAGRGHGRGRDARHRDAEQHDAPGAGEVRGERPGSGGGDDAGGDLARELG